MQILIIANSKQKSEWMANGNGEGPQIEWNENLSVESEKKLDAVIDLLFQNDPVRISELKKMADTVIINSVADSLAETDRSFVRINGWPGFLSSSIMEASAGSEQQEITEKIFSQFGKSVQWLGDSPGFVRPRVISMIVNEAFLALEEGVSTKEDIDKAMKLGTNYPYGPFEWSELIGRGAIASLLHKLAITDERYRPAKSIAEVKG